MKTDRNLTGYMTVIKFICESVFELEYMKY